VHRFGSYCTEHHNVETDMCQHLNCWMFNYLGSMSSKSTEIFDCHVYYRVWIQSPV